MYMIIIIIIIIIVRSYYAQSSISPMRPIMDDSLEVEQMQLFYQNYYLMMNNYSLCFEYFQRKKAAITLLTSWCIWQKSTRILYAASSVTSQGFILQGESKSLERVMLHLKPHPLLFCLLNT